MKQAYLIRTDSSQERIFPVDGKTFSAIELHNYVKGDPAFIWNLPGSCMMVHNGGKARLPANLKATAISGLEIHGDAVFGPQEQIDPLESDEDTNAKRKEYHDQ